MNGSGSRRRLRLTIVALGAVAYAGLLGWLAMKQPTFDAVSMRGRIAEIAARPAAPVDPMPAIEMAARTELAMQRDPMR